jgi:holdfast attachment protein HfaA
MTRIPSASFALAALGVLASVSAAGAQSFSGAAPQAGGVSSLEAGYGGAGRVASQPFQPSTRDANGNRLVVTSETGAGLSSSSATAIGNLISVQVSGRNNTVVLNARQVNNGQLNARVDL